MLAGEIWIGTKSSVRCSKSAVRTEIFEDIQIRHIFFLCYSRKSMNRDVDLHERFAVLIELSADYVDVQVVMFGTGNIQLGLRVADQLGIGAECVHKVRAIIVPGV